MGLFEYKSYKTLLKDHIHAVNRRGYITEMATAAGCTQSYLSQVVHGKPELTPDQGLGLAEFFGFGPIETEYFLLLVQFARATTPKLREHLKKQITDLAARRLHTEAAVKATSDGAIAEKLRDFYYASWTIGAVHILTACADTQRADQIAARLHLPLSEVTHVLQWLIEHGFVKREADRFVHSGKNVHLPTASIHNRVNHLNWRLKGLESTSDKQSIHYTSAFAISAADRDKLKQKLLAYIEEQRRDIGSSGSETPFVFCCDLFEV